MAPIPRALSTLTDQAEDFLASPPTEPRLAHREPARLAALLDLAAVEDMLADHALPHPLFTMSHNGKTIPGRSITRGDRGPRALSRDLTRDLPDLIAIRDRLTAGATLILEQLNRTHRPIAALCRRLGYELNRPLWAAGFLTPANAQGFGLHYDTDGVFVLQCVGHKTWDVYPPVLPFPLNHQRWRPDTLSPAERKALLERGPHARYELAPGDVLWLPRGWLHDVYTTGHTSLHVSLAVPELSRYQLVTLLLKSLADSEEFRHDLPFDTFAGEVSARQESELALQSFAAWLSKVDPDDLAGQARDWLRAMRHPARSSPITAVLRSDEEIAAAGGLIVVREAVAGFARTPDGGLVLDLGDRDLTLDPRSADFVGDLLAADDPAPVPVETFRARLGADTMRVIRSLLGEGIVELAT